MTARDHAVVVENEGDKARWTCKCGCSGNLQDDRKAAWDFGLQHLQIEKPVRREG